MALAKMSHITALWVLGLILCNLLNLTSSNLHLTLKLQKCLILLMEKLHRHITKKTKDLSKCKLFL